MKASILAAVILHFWIVKSPVPETISNRAQVEIIDQKH